MEFYRADSREKLMAYLFATMPLFIYLGRSLFYIHYFLSIVIFFVVCKSVGRLNKSFGPIFFTIVLYFVLTVAINLYPTEYDSYSDLSKQLSVFFMVISICYISQYLFIVSEFSFENRNYAVSSISVSIFLVSLVILGGYCFDLNIIYTIKNFELTAFNDAHFHAKQSYLVLGCCFPIYGYFKKPSFFAFLILLSFFLATFITSGRTAIVILVFSSVVYLCLAMGGNMKKRHYLLVLMLLLVGILSVSYISSGDPFDVFNIHTSNRLEGSIKYIEYVSEHSPVWGLGLGAGKYLQELGVIKYGSPHNIFLDAFVTMGVVGLVVFALFLFFILIVVGELYRNSCDPHQGALLISTFVAVFLAGQMYLSIWSKHNMVLVFFYMYLAASFITTKGKVRVVKTSDFLK